MGRGLTVHEWSTQELLATRTAPFTHQHVRKLEFSSAPVSSEHSLYTKKGAACSRGYKLHLNKICWYCCWSGLNCVVPCAPSDQDEVSLGLPGAERKDRRTPSQAGVPGTAVTPAEQQLLPAAAYGHVQASATSSLSARTTSQVTRMLQGTRVSAESWRTSPPDFIKQG